MSLSSADAAFAGLRLARREPKAVALWALVYAAMMVVTSVLTVLWAGGDLAQLDLEAASSGDLSAVEGLLSAGGKLYTLAAIQTLVSSALFTTAVLRAELAPEERKFGYLRLGKDELRMAVLTVILGVLLLIVALVTVFVVAVAAGLVAAGGGEGGLGAIVAGFFASLLSLIAFLVVFAYFGVRLSLSAPLVFAEKRIDMVDAWRLTQGVFWRTLGAYIVAWFVALGFVFLGFVLMILINLSLGGAQTSLAPTFGPAAIVSTIVSSLLTAMQYAIVVAPTAAIYRDRRLDPGPAPAPEAEPAPAG